MKQILKKALKRPGSLPGLLNASLRRIHEPCPPRQYDEDFRLFQGKAMVYNVVKLLHVLAVIFWLGGMAYTLFFVRPALACLPPPLRLQTLRGLLARFLGAVLAAILIALASGAWMLADVASQVRATGGSLNIPPAWHLMAGLGVVMAAIYFYVRYALFARLNAAVERADWPAGAQVAATLRTWVGVNLVLGVLIVAAVLL
ncbi:CopD family protein [Bordetella holmesii]|nr:CopD family protein [Bordetella holmesii]AMD46319.1 hypothetical protein H558_12900 [Bordetella holmesii H558]EWM48085.1 copper resistance D family protein [Bordetella holmesii 35009]EWM49069.1 copper resistance D family protein [Bordetella holmesii 70147]KAK77357.1 copper resistance protein D [Bordetella holmesii H620]KAK81444.1 copper resistance protein D [Bordetella holmesii CDC-H809-BH]KAK99070.1 copper resistance protein D [Bordetella holmesii CDC-H635-BH]KCV00631.1 copper resistance